MCKVCLSLWGSGVDKFILWNNVIYHNVISTSYVSDWVQHGPDLSTSYCCLKICLKQPKMSWCEMHAHSVASMTAHRSCMVAQFGHNTFGWQRFMLAEKWYSQRSRQVTGNAQSCRRKELDMNCEKWLVSFIQDVEDWFKGAVFA